MNLKEKILLSFFLIAVFINFLGPINDPDFPFHLKTGEYIYEHKEIPIDDPFSFYGEGYTTDRERFTLSQYWLAQIIFYKLYLLAGPLGIILLRATVFSLFVFLLWFSLRKRGFYSSLMVAALITILFQVAKGDRPQFFSFLFILILILLFERFREKPESKIPLYLIPPLMLLWANIHAGFIFGVAVILLYALSEGFKLFVDKPFWGCPLEKKQALVFFIAALISILFSYINPDVNGQILAVIDSHTNAKWVYSVNREYMNPIKEMSVYFGARTSAVVFFIIFGFVSIILCLNATRRKSIDITAFILILFSSVAAFTAVRYIPFFVAVALPLSRKYKFLENTDFLKRLKRSKALFALLMVFFISTMFFGFKRYPQIFIIDKLYYPAEAANFLLSNRIEANIFNQFNKGSYLLWKLYPHYKLFNDTRFISLEAVRDTDVITYTLEDYNQPTSATLGKRLSELVPEELGEINISSEGHTNKKIIDKPLWKRLLDQYRIDLIVHEATADFSKAIYPLTLRLLKDDDWVLIYFDGTMQIFIRNKEKYANVIKSFRKPKELIYDEIIFETIPHVSAKVAISSPYSSLAFAYTMKGKDEDARRMIDAALSLNKNDLVANFCEAYLVLRRNAQEKSGASKGK